MRVKILEFKTHSRKAITRDFHVDIVASRRKMDYSAGKKKTPSSGGESRKPKGGGGGGRGGQGQRCLVKARNGNDKSANMAHLKYIVRSGVGKDGLDPETVGSTLEEMIPDRKERQFRFIISPENPGADLKKTIAAAVEHLEKVTGKELIWIAAIHYNTAHPHAHLVVRGKDKNQKMVLFAKEVFKKTLRTTLQDNLTAELGNRPQSMAKESGIERLDSYQPHPLDSHFPDEGLFFRLSSATIQEKLSLRLSALIRFGLAHYGRNGGVVFHESWKSDLRKNSYLDSYMEGLRKIHVSQAAYSNVDPIKDIGFTGNIIASGKVSELDDRTYLIIESQSRAIYILSNGKNDTKGIVGKTATIGQDSVHIGERVIGLNDENTRRDEKTPVAASRKQEKDKRERKNENTKKQNNLSILEFD